jgi:hypothetical protein
VRRRLKPTQRPNAKLTAIYAHNFALGVAAAER